MSTLRDLSRPPCAIFQSIVNCPFTDRRAIEIDLTKLRFEHLKEYHALNEFIENNYKEGVSNYLMIDEVQLCEGNIANF